MKKGAPIIEDKNSLVEQVPDDLMGKMIRGHVELGLKKTKLKSRHLKMSKVMAELTGACVCTLALF